MATERYTINGLALYTSTDFLFPPSPVLPDDYPALEKVSDSAIKEKQKFERLVVPKETLLEMFSVSGNTNTLFHTDMILILFL